MANVLNGQFINWSAMTGSQVRAKVKEMQALAKLQDKAPEKAAAKIAKAVERTVKPAPKKPDTVTKAAVKKAVAKPAAKAKAAKSIKAVTPVKDPNSLMGSAIAWIKDKNLVAVAKATAINTVIEHFKVTRYYAAKWLQSAAV